MRTVIFLFLFLHCASIQFAQSPQTDLNKYWNYRSRFLGKDGGGGFISVGPEQGQSIPATGRNIDCDCLRDWALIQSKAPRREGTGIVKWGDATVYLGYYLAMLAMEYENLQSAGIPTDENRKELYYALKAYERLDSLAEVTLGLPGKVNGFFLRDDVPNDFHLGGDEEHDRRFQDTERGTYDCVGSDYSKGTRAVDNGSYVSQDQAIALLFGFAYVKKFAGDAQYSEGDTTRFGDLATYYSHLIVKYMSEKKWQLRSPDGQKISSRWGGDARAFSDMIALAAERITESRFGYNYRKRTFMGRLAKGTFRWAFGLQGDNNHGMIFQLVMLTDDWTSEQYAKRARKADNILYALADVVLNDRTLDSSIPKSQFDTLIRTAPWNGPCSGTAGCEAPAGWRSGDLWWHPNHKDGDPYGRTFEYTGIDFMLLYNLYHYYYREEMPKYKAPGEPEKRKGEETLLNTLKKVENLPRH
jgi:hypothetical protein